MLCNLIQSCVACATDLMLFVAVVAMVIPCSSIFLTCRSLSQAHLLDESALRTILVQIQSQHRMDMLRWENAITAK